MTRTLYRSIGSQTRNGSPARRRGRLCSGTLVTLVLVALCCALPGFAREAAAQQFAAIQATATVTSSYSTYGLQADSPATAGPAKDRHAQRLAIPGVGVLQVEGAAGAQVRLLPQAPDGHQAEWMQSSVQAAASPRSGAARLVQASIAYVAN